MSERANPTHLAVALDYDRAKAAAPRIVAKGAGDLARRIKHVATRAGVPIVEHRALARRLFQDGDLDRPIPESLYEPVAQIYAGIAREPAPRVEVQQ